MIRQVSSRRVRLAAVAVALGVVAAGCLGFNVTKRVVGDSTGPFDIAVSCDNDFLDPQTQTETFDTFDTNGEQTIFFGDFILSPISEASTTVCTFTEPDDAGASSVLMECLTPIPDGITCSAPGPTLTVTAPAAASADDEYEVDIRVTNTFDPDTPTTPTTAPSNAAAEAVTAQPNTTG